MADAAASRPRPGAAAVAPPAPMNRPRLRRRVAARGAAPAASPHRSAIASTPRRGLGLHLAEMLRAW